MPPVQLSRLRPQVNALMSHYDDEALFTKTLQLILEKYSEKQNTTNAWLRFDPGIPAYYDPPVVLNELESALELLAKTQPQACVGLAEAMWELPQFEPKKLAIFLLAHLGGEHKEAFIQHTRDWYIAGISEALVAEIIQQSSQRMEIVTSREWLNLLNSWLLSDDKNTQKIGLRAVQTLVDNRAFHNLPVIYTLITPLYSDPRITLQRDLTELTRKLIERSQPETAAFLISMVEINQKDSVSALVRKLLPLFDDFYQAEIRQAVV
ncbi:MAG: hypothetical protein PWQ55_2320 [Chloroflexota bacterium]|nr:hypothetical protein [Chloroflexota bacterium]